MSDLISRQAVLDKFKSLCDVCGEGEKYDGVMCRCCYLDDGICIVEDMPSAESEQKWIPFDIALPNDRQKVLCINKHDEMMVGGYLTDYGMTFPCYFEKPVAWLPLPEPWRGE